MIQPMLYLQLSGQVDDLDRVITKYLCHYKIQYEDSHSFIPNTLPFSSLGIENPYKIPLLQAKYLLSFLDSEQTDVKYLNLHSAISLVEDLYLRLLPDFPNTPSKDVMLLLWAKRLDIIRAYQTILHHHFCFCIKEYAALQNTECNNSYNVESQINSSCLSYILCFFLPNTHAGHLISDLTYDSKIILQYKELKRFGEFKHYESMNTHEGSRLHETLNSNSSSHLYEYMKSHASFESAVLSIPLYLTLPAPLKPMQAITQNYCRPLYNQFDPTLLLTILIFFLYGTFYGDIGIGIVLLLTGCIGYYRKNTDYFGPLIICGISSLLFGVLYVTCFLYTALPQKEFLSISFVRRILDKSSSIRQLLWNSIPSIFFSSLIFAGATLILFYCNRKSDTALFFFKQPKWSYFTLFCKVIQTLSLFSLLLTLLAPCYGIVFYFERQTSFLIRLLCNGIIVLFQIFTLLLFSLLGRTDFFIYKNTCISSKLFHPLKP